MVLGIFCESNLAGARFDFLPFLTVWCERERDSGGGDHKREEEERLKFSHLVEFKELPEENAQLLGEKYLLD